MGEGYVSSSHTGRLLSCQTHHLPFFRFLDLESPLTPSFALSHVGTKIIYRHYATLYFIFVVDSSESELGILDLIQTFVESLDTCFKDVCELDLIFNMEKIHYILDEIIQGGMVIETRKEEILKAVNEMKAKEASEEQLTTQIKEAFGK